MQRLFLAFLLIIIPFCNIKPIAAFYSEQNALIKAGDYFLHTVEPGQTVFSISRMYNVTVEAIYQMNPESRDVIKTGDELKIPQESGSFLFHTIQPKETLYSVSRMYQMKGEDIMSVNHGLTAESFTIGKVIRIPTNRVTTPMSGPEDYMQRITNALLYSNKEIERLGDLNVALLLPFASDPRMVEYLEGFFLALQEMKGKISVELFVRDIGRGTDSLLFVLKQPEMKKAHLIIGGLSEQQIRLIANFSREENIPYVIPFAYRSDETMSYSTVYQVNMPQPYMYFRASTAFCNRYRDSKIVFHIPSKPGNQAEFVRQVQRELRAKNIAYTILTNDALTLTDIVGQLDGNKATVFVPSDDSADALSKLIIPLRSALNSNPQMQVSLFGYPGWQASGANFSKDLSRFKATFFSGYYLNTTSSQYKTFYNNFIRWYSKDLISVYPKYGLLGYDTGSFFIQALNSFGKTFTSNIDKFKYSGIQIDFTFERVNNWGGFINTSLYFVDYLSDGTIVANPVK
jgi:LysM repeat protein